MIGFLVGYFIGALTGFALCAMLRAGKDEDE